MEEGTGNENSRQIGREKQESFRREDAIARVPPVVVAVPRVDVPLAVVIVPVHVHDAGTLVSEAIYATVHRIFFGLNLIWDMKVR